MASNVIGLNRRSFFSTLVGAAAAVALTGVPTATPLRASDFDNNIISILRELRDLIAKTPDGFVAALGRDGSFSFLSKKQAATVGDQVMLIPKTALPQLDKFLAS